MSRICNFTGKRPMSGNSVSHSNNRIKRKFFPNIQKKKFFNPDTGKWMTLKLSTTAIRNIDKKGLQAFLREQEAKGNKVN